MAGAILPAQNPFQGNGIPSTFVEISPAIVGQQVTFTFGSPTTPLPIAIFAISDGIGPVTIPIPLFGTIGLDLFSPAYLAIGIGLDAQGNATLSIPLPTPTFTSTTPPLFAHVATLEPNALSICKTVRLDWVDAGSWEGVDALAAPRQLHTATALGSGPRDNVTEVLIAGGTLNSVIVPNPLASAELFSPLTRRTTALPPLSIPRAGHRAVRLNDGRILVTGGVTTGGIVSADCEFFDPASNTFVPAPAMNARRTGHALTLLDDGRVLVSGGAADWQNPATQFIAALNSSQDTAELFDPSSNAWVPVAAVMASKRLGHSQTKLNDGRVLIVSGIRGGYSGSVVFGSTGQIPIYTTSCEVFDPSTNTFSPAAPLTYVDTVAIFTYTYNGRAFHGASLLPSGRVLLTGGFVATIPSTAQNDETISVPFCSVWDPATDTWTQTTKLPIGVAFHTQEAHGNGAIFCGGFTAPLFLLTPTSTTGFHDGTTVTPLVGIGAPSVSGGVPRGAHSMTRLHDGSFLVYGGGAWPATLGDGFLYTPN